MVWSLNFLDKTWCYDAKLFHQSWNSKHKIILSPMRQRCVFIACSWNRPLEIVAILKRHPWWRPSVVWKVWKYVLNFFLHPLSVLVCITLAFHALSKVFIAPQNTNTLWACCVCICDNKVQIYISQSRSFKQHFAHFVYNVQIGRLCKLEMYISFLLQRVILLSSPNKLFPSCLATLYTIVYNLQFIEIPQLIQRIRTSMDPDVAFSQ